MECTCDPLSVDGYSFNTFIARYLADCIYTPQDYISFTVAYIGLVASVCSLIPQFILNYQLKSCEGLSFYLLLFWTLGDFGSLLGAILTSQLEPQIVTSAVFFTMDFTMCLQYGYYQYMRPFMLGYQVVSSSEQTEEEVDTSAVGSNTTNANLGNAAAVAAVATTAATLLPTASAFSIVKSIDSSSLAGLVLPLCNAQVPVSREAKMIGYALSWCAGLFYFTSRIPQVWKNFKNKTVEGLSMALFLLTIIGNLGYGLSVCLRLPVIDERFWLATLPFLIGSLGVLMFDFFTLAQFYWYSSGSASALLA